jgi:stearoyl-CoA desaturase (delta-9 desaturase)
VHHRYTDTPKDPYNAQGGFWYAHVGWMLIKPDPANHAKADIKDLDRDPLIRFQHKYYLYVGPFCAMVFPTLIGGIFWGDWAGSFFYAGAARLFFVHHSTFCVNSVAHYFGEHSYDDDRSPRDHFITALVTFGEGYHNFHHEFPNDYRNGIQWYHYDPTKWLIAGLAKLGATFNLRVFPKNEIKRGILYMREKKLAELRKDVVVPLCKETLPAWTWAQVKAKVAGEGEDDQKNNKRMLVVVDGYVHDVAAFLPTHPGGKILLQAYIGKDATEVFFGRTTPVVYQHSHAAHNLLSNMRVASIIPEEKQQTQVEEVKEENKKEQ